MLKTRPVTDEELMQLSVQNPELQFERDEDGSLVTMSPVGGISGNREAKAIARLTVWVEDNDLGETFSSSTGFRLSNGALRSPDAAFVAKGRLPEDWDQAPKDSFIPLAPDFVIEIRSGSDSLEKLKAKMVEYIEQGVKLGWLVDRKSRLAYVYRADGTVTQYPEASKLSGEAVVQGFELAVSRLL